MNRILAFFFFIFLAGCAENSSENPATSLRDSVIQKYFYMQDSVNYFDTSEITYRILKDYVRNDTAHLLQIKDMLEKSDKSRDFHGLLKCQYPQKLAELNAEEAYRFELIKPFCDMVSVITISKSGNQIALHFLELIPHYAGRKTQEFQYQGKKITIDSNCTILKQVYRNLAEKKWDQLKYALVKADYWGLKSHVTAQYLDPASWTIFGHKKSNRESYETIDHKVVRTPPTSNEFKALGLLFFQLAGEVSSCNSDQARITTNPVIPRSSTAP